MAWCPLLNSTIVASRKFVFPPRGDVTCTGMRTALACGKNRASCSAQLLSLATSAGPPLLPTSPHCFALESTCRNEPRDTSRSNKRRLPLTNVHATSQRIPKIIVGEGAETEGLRISQQSCDGSNVSP